MSMVEVKETVAEMSAEERLEIAAFIAHLNRADSPEYQTELDRRMSAMDAGKKTSAQDLKRRHKDLLERGR
jgi:cytochrome c